MCIYKAYTYVHSERQRERERACKQWITSIKHNFVFSHQEICGNVWRNLSLLWHPGFREGATGICAEARDASNPATHRTALPKQWLSSNVPNAEKPSNTCVYTHSNSHTGHGTCVNFSHKPSHTFRALLQPSWSLHWEWSVNPDLSELRQLCPPQ